MRWPSICLAVLCLFTAEGYCAVTRLRIVHTNDMHARFDQTSQLSGKCSDSDANNGKCYGGFPRIVTAVEEQKRLSESNGYPLLFLNGGDSYQGTVWYSLFKWKIVADFVNRLGFDALSLGNHEFDDGIPGLVPFIKNLSSPILACNLGYADEPDLQALSIKSSVVIEKGGMKIGIIGYLTPETITLSQPGKVEFFDEIMRISEEAARLKKTGVNLIIGLGHSGYAKDIEIAQMVPDIDVVVGAHSHSFLYTGKPPDVEIPVGPYPTIITQKSGRMVPVVQAYAYTKYLGILDVDIDENGEVVKASGSPLLLDASIKEDGEMLRLLDEWALLRDNATKEEIATSRVLLDGSCRYAECNLGNIVTDAFIDYSLRNVPETNWTKAAIAIYSGGGVRASIDSSSGAITREDVIVVFPFYNQISMLTVKGRYLLEALEWSVARYDPNHVENRGEFLQMSGLHVTYDITKPVGSRVVRVTARCANCPYPKYEPIDPNSSYSIVTSSFIANGGDNYTMLSDNKEDILLFDSLDTDIIVEFLRKKEIITDGVEERIQFVSENSPSNPHGKGAASVPYSSSLTVTTSFASVILNLIFTKMT